MDDALSNLERQAAAAKRESADYIELLHTDLALRTPVGAMAETGAWEPVAAMLAHFVENLLNVMSGASDMSVYQCGHAHGTLTALRTLQDLPAVCRAKALAIARELDQLAEDAKE